MKRIPLVAAILMVGTVLAPADLVSERWGGKDTPCTHPGTMKVAEAQTGRRLVFDLSPIPRGARVHRASLYCFTEDDRQPTEPPLVFVVDRLETGGKPVHKGDPLRLEPPWYRSFDATEAVRRWVADPKRNVGLAVERFERFLAPRTYLEVLYEGEAKDVPEQVTGLHTLHHDGQTFIVWTEAAAFRPAPAEVIWVKKFSENGDVLASGPGDGAYDLPHHPGITLLALRRLQGLGLRDKASGFQGIRGLKRIRQVPPVTYRVYRHTERITAANIHEAERLAEVGPLAGYDTETYKIHFKGEYLNQREEPTSVIPTYCVDTGKALTPGEALYVHTPRVTGESWYAVTTALAGTENLADITDANSLEGFLCETAATPQPVLQWRQEDRYRKEATEHWFRYWAAPPQVNLPSRSFRVAYAVGENFKEPGPLTIGTISGAFNVREEIRVPKADRITLAVKRQLDWLPALFYNEGGGPCAA